MIVFSGVFLLMFLGFIIQMGLYIYHIIPIDNNLVLDKSRSVSILVAARNEEDKILRCLKALNKLNYPLEKIEILIGDDQSEDSTAQLILSFIKDKPQFKYFEITHRYEGIHGKQNVLANLAHFSKGEILMVTDADIEVHPNWAAGLSGGFESGISMVNGPTVVEGKGLFSMMQTLDWLLGISVATAHARMGIPLTGVGNNMAVLREDYFGTGGYENIEFSVTEDYKLFKEMIEKQGKGNVQLLHPWVYNKTLPIETFGGLLTQRKRWFKGGMEIPWYNQVFIVFTGLFHLALFLGIFLLPNSVLFVGLVLKVFIEILFLFIAAGKLKKRKFLWYYPVFSLYIIFMVLILPINQLLPGGVNWKGRTYS